MLDDAADRAISQEILPRIRALMATELSEDVIRSDLRRRQFHEVLITEAMRRANERQVLIHKIAPGIRVRGEQWYIGPQTTDRRWPAFLEMLREKKWSADDLEELDRSTSRIVSMLGAPRAFTPIPVKGLVVGAVQSGKTTSYAGVIAKAADAGYKLVIVIAGMTDRLRTQTQKRLTRELVDPNPDLWHTITGPNWDFTEQVMQVQAAAMLAPGQAATVLGVVKKNRVRLERLIAWLRRAQTQLADCPTLIIDDEADEASINTAAAPGAQSPIPRLIHELMNTMPRVSYVAYTATPFANLLSLVDDPATGQMSSLYPSTFIEPLKRPAAYFGPTQVFGRRFEDGTGESQGLDMVRFIPDNEALALKVPNRAARFTFVPPIVPSLDKAVHHFVVATAARRAGGARTSHSTMLVHTSQFVAVHATTKRELDGLVESFRQRWVRSRAAALADFEAAWHEEMAGIADQGPHGVTWSGVRDEIQGVLEDLRVYIENGFSSELDFEAGQVTGIVVGGNVLSRGLTIEGLVCSYFIRTASAYDTLLQMGRWFGYRPGYAHMMRVWMPQSLAADFAELARVEEEMHDDISRYERDNLTPIEFAVRIRQHPSLLVTARMKMRHAVTAKIGFAGREISTRVFKYRDDDWIRAAWTAAEQLLRRARVTGKPLVDVPGGKLLEGVSVDMVLEFLDGYPVHERCGEFKKPLVMEYIRSALQSEARQLAKWNVVVVQRESDGINDTKLVDGNEFMLMSRSRSKQASVETEYADIRALTGERDAGLDLGLTPEALRNLDRSAIIDRRSEVLPDVGLLLLYPIWKDSVPRSRTIAAGEPAPKDERLPLQASDHLLGAALVFPGSEQGLANYVSADLSVLAPVGGEEAEVYVETEDGILPEAT